MTNQSQQPDLQHIPVLLDETLHWLTQSSLVEAHAGIFVDATFGRGGHSRGLLERIGPDARIIAIDQDAQAVVAGASMAKEDQRLSVVKGRFSDLARTLESMGIESVVGVLLDVGVSSPQLDDPQRGFSFKTSGPLDMRMDPQQGESAAQWLNTASEVAIVSVLREFGEERFAKRIARNVVANRPLQTTGELADVVSAVIPRRAQPAKHPATKTFQAVRIFINRELDELKQGIESAFSVLCQGGRLAVISFHSLEDRIVKQRFRELCNPPPMPRRLPIANASMQVQAKAIAGPIKAGMAELARNPRARSATLRVIEKVGESG